MSDTAGQRAEVTLGGLYEMSIEDLMNVEIE